MKSSEKLWGTGSPSQARGVARTEGPRLRQSRSVRPRLRCRVRVRVLAGRPAAVVDPRASSAGSPGVRERARAPACRAGEGLDGARQRLGRAARLPAQAVDGHPASGGGSRPGAAVAGPDDGAVAGSPRRAGMRRQVGQDLIEANRLMPGAFDGEVPFSVAISTLRRVPEGCVNLHGHPIGRDR